MIELFTSTFGIVSSVIAAVCILTSISAIFAIVKNKRKLAFGLLSVTALVLAAGTAMQFAPEWAIIAPLVSTVAISWLAVVLLFITTSQKSSGKHVIAYNSASSVVFDTPIVQKLHIQNTIVQPTQMIVIDNVAPPVRTQVEATLYRPTTSTHQLDYIVNTAPAAYKQQQYAQNVQHLQTLAAMDLPEYQQRYVHVGQVENTPDAACDQLSAISQSTNPLIKPDYSQPSWVVGYRSPYSQSAQPITNKYQYKQAPIVVIRGRMIRKKTEVEHNQLDNAKFKLNEIEHIMGAFEPRTQAQAIDVDTNIVKR
jgi:hypothetical protein